MVRQVKHTQRVEEPGFTMGALAHYETIMAQGNGYLGLRAAHEEDYVGGARGFYIAGTYNKDSQYEVAELPNLADILNMGHLTNEWLSTNPWAMISIVVVSVWGSVGFEAILFLNGLQALPGDMLEAGIVDGSRGFKTLYHIILPNLRETFVVTGIWAILQALKVFIVPSLVTWGGPGTATTVMYMYIYRQSFTYLDMGYGAALGFILSVIILGLSLLNMRLSKRS